MKKIILFTLLISGVLNAQEFTTDNKTITGVFEVKNKSKSEIFASINKWIALSSQNSSEAIKMNDLDSGTIVMVGQYGVNFINETNAILYPIVEIKDNYVIYRFMTEINVRDNKFKITFKLTNIIDLFLDTYLDIYNIIPKDLFFQCYDFNTLDENSINKYNDLIDKYYTKERGNNEKRKKEREQILSLSKPMFQNLLINTTTSFKNLMFLCEKSVVGDNSKW